MLKQVTGHFGPESPARNPREGVVQYLKKERKKESFRPGSFWPGSIRPWVVSAQFGGSFRPILAHLSRSLIGELIVYKGIRRPSVRL